MQIVTDQASHAAKPRVFVGSSVEGLPIAEQIQLNLDYFAECTIWSQGVFGLSGGTLESLCRALGEFDFAVLALTPDDLIQKREHQRNSPRDNVLFELGLFMGALGRERTFVVYCRDVPLDLPTDLAGVTAATFAKRKDGNLQAALGPVCTQIKTAIGSILGSRTSKDSSHESDSIARLMAELKTLRTDLTAQTENVRRVLNAVTSATSTGQTPTDLRFLEGIWKNSYSESTAYVRARDNAIGFPYCYGGNGELTGEYYNWKLVDDALFARFRWFESPISGYAYFRILSDKEIAGGWWYAEDVPSHLIDRLPQVDGMHEARWVKISTTTTKFPKWAEAYYRKRLPTGEQ